MGLRRFKTSFLVALGLSLLAKVLFEVTVGRSRGAPFSSWRPSSRSMSLLPKRPEEWRAALDALPDVAQNAGKIPTFFFAHGQPLLAWPSSLGVPPHMVDMWNAAGHESPQANFLQDFGRALLSKYKPKGILVFSAHWETSGERLVTDYGDENPLLMDYFGFPDKLYRVGFRSKGDSLLTERVVEAFKQAGYRARASPASEPRGEDGRGFSGPGLDHGVFVPFMHMFGSEPAVPIVQASIDAHLDPESEWKLGKAVESLRSDGILILSGGLTIHNLREFGSFSERTARTPYIDFDKAVDEAMLIADARDRKKALFDLAAHPAFSLAHPRAEHFVPLYVAAGAAEEGKSKVLEALYGAKTVAFGLL